MAPDVGVSTGLSGIGLWLVVQRSGFGTCDPALNTEHMRPGLGGRHHRRFPVAKAKTASCRWKHDWRHLHYLPTVVLFGSLLSSPYSSTRRRQRFCVMHKIQERPKMARQTGQVVILPIDVPGAVLLFPPSDRRQGSLLASCVAIKETCLERSGTSAAGQSDQQLQASSGARQAAHNVPQAVRGSFTLTAANRGIGLE